MAVKIPINKFTRTPANEASYIVYRDGNTYYAKNGTTGAVEISSADAADVIQHAVNRGDLVVIKKGTYQLSRRININRNNVRIIGEGGYGWHWVKGSTVIESPASEYALYIRGNGIALEHLTIDGKNSGSGIYVDNAYGVLFNSINIIDADVGIMSAPTYYNSFITVIHPNMLNVRKGIILDADTTSPNAYRSEQWTIIGGAIYGTRNNYGEVGIRMVRFDFITIISTLIAYMDTAYHIAGITGNEWTTMHSPKAEAVNKGMLIEDGYVDIYGLDIIGTRDYIVRVLYNAREKVNIRGVRRIQVQIAIDSTNTIFSSPSGKEIIQMPVTMRTIENVSVIQAGPSDTFELLIRSYVGVAGERIKLQTRDGENTNFLDRITISNKENVARVSVKNSVLNIAPNLTHATPMEGDIWIDKTNSRLCIYLNGAWKCVNLT